MAQIAEPTETAMANQALSLIRQKAITDLEADTSNAAKVVRKWFAVTRDALLRRYEWNFAKHYSTIGATNDELANFRWANHFDLPSGNENYCLKVLAVEGCEDADWQVLARRIATNAPSPINITYVRRIVEVATWDALFRQVFPISLAQAIAPELAEDERISKLLENAMAAVWDGAVAADASEGVPEENNLSDFEFIASRFR